MHYALCPMLYAPGETFLRCFDGMRAGILDGENKGILFFYIASERCLFYN